MKKRRRNGKKLLTEPKSEWMRTKDAGIERIDLWQIWWTRSNNVFLRKVEKWEEKGVVFIGKVHGRRSDALIRDKTNQKTTCVMRHLCFQTTCQMFVYLTTSAFSTVNPLTLSPSTQSFQPSTCNFLTVTLIGPFFLITMDQKGWRGQLKRIKMKLDGPCKMGLTDPCLWADKRQAQFL